MATDDARTPLERIISENQKVHLRFESVDGSVSAKVDGFLGRNPLGELLIKSTPSGVTESFNVKFALDFVCDYAEIPSTVSESSKAIRLRFKNGDILLVLGVR